MLRLRAGWLIPKKVLALTHFVPEVTATDFAEITQATQAAIAQVEREFHLIIDNRIIDNTELASLEMMLQFMPQLNHPQLRCIVMVLPEKLKGSAHQIESAHYKQIDLTYADTLPSAFDYLRSVDGGIDWAAIDETFFTP